MTIESIAALDKLFQGVLTIDQPAAYIANNRQACAHTDINGNVSGTLLNLLAKARLAKAHKSKVDPGTAWSYFGTILTGLCMHWRSTRMSTSQTCSICRASEAAIGQGRIECQCTTTVWCGAVRSRWSDRKSNDDKQARQDNERCTRQFFGLKEQ